MNLAYRHVDVFSDVPFGGNGLPVFPDARDVPADALLRITQELRQFEAVFLTPTDDPELVDARIFDLFGELPFAGHPIIGAAAVLHELAASDGPRRWRFRLSGGRIVVVDTRRTGRGFFGLLDQGAPTFLGTPADAVTFAAAFDLHPDDLAADLPLEVVSTGLRYLVVPVRPGVLARARIVRDVTELLRGVGAEFAVLLDESGHELRHWNNDGIIEDVATGSAAGAVGAYLLRHGRVDDGVGFRLNQGQFAGRPSTLHVRARADAIEVGGDVAFVGRGVIELDG